MLEHATHQTTTHLVNSPADETYVFRIGELLDRHVIRIGGHRGSSSSNSRMAMMNKARF